MHAKMLSQAPANSMAYSLGPIAIFLMLYVGEGSVSKVLGPAVWINDSDLVSTLYFACSVTHALARDHLASQSAPAWQVSGFGASATDACCSAVMQPDKASMDIATIEIRKYIALYLIIDLCGTVIPIESPATERDWLGA